MSLPGLKNAIPWSGQSRVRAFHLWKSSECALDHDSLSYLSYFPDSILAYLDSPLDFKQTSFHPPRAPGHLLWLCVPCSLSRCLSSSRQLCGFRNSPLLRSLFLTG